MDVGIVLIVAIVSVAIGYFAGLVLSKSRKPDNQTDTEPVVEVQADDGPRYEADRLTMILWSKTPDGPLFADINGKRFASPTELQVVERNRVTRALNNFQMWMGRPILKTGNTGPLPPLEEPVPPEPVVTAIREELPVAGKHNDQPPPPIPMENTTPPEAIEPQADTTQPVTPVPATISLKSKPKPAESQNKSIVEQINEIIQDKIPGTPLEESGLKLQETPKGVLVWVGNQSYLCLDTLPEGEAKKIIRAAVAEWKKKERLQDCNSTHPVIL